MSIFSDLITKKITFSQAVAEGETWFSHILSGAPAAVQTAVSTGLSDFKQAASNAVSLADAAIAPHLAEATTVVEAAVDKLMTVATGGIGTPLIPLVNDGIDQLAAALKAEIDAGAAKAKASLAAAPKPPTE